jgi:CTP:molybdopterin cytidylyltransferase MocA
MNPPTYRANSLHAVSGSQAAEETLRLIANMPAPQGLEDRLKAGLHAAPHAGRVLPWPGAFDSARGWVHSTVARSAAAAAIVFVVAGGGWSVYTRTQPAQAPKAVVMPPRLAAPGSFSSAGAMRTPQTFNQPVLVHSADAASKPDTAKITAHKSHHKAKPSAAKRQKKSPSN